MKVVLIIPEPDEPDGRLAGLLAPLIRELPADCEAEVIRRPEELHPLRGVRIFFAVALGAYGVNRNWIFMQERIRREPDFFEGSVGAAAVDGASELYTKSVGRELVFSANLAGCLFPGRPLVEATGSLMNFSVTAKNLGCDLLAAYRESLRDLLDRLLAFRAPAHSHAHVLALHASIRETSNTLRLWGKVKRGLSEKVDVTEISLRNGEICDCGGCPYTTCMHFSERGRCYYGGVIVEQVYPAVESCDALVMLCPNYNDALSANLCAFINRLTALYRRRQFFEKYLFGLTVSGYSGGDILAEQLIGSLNMNKTFILPPRFTMLETANDPGSVERIPGIDERAAAFAGAMNRILLRTETTLP